MSAPAITRNDWIFVAASLVVWSLVVAFLGPSGDFPLNDDWAYSRAAARLLEIGAIERVAWTWVPAITHSFLGAAFAAVLDLPFLEAVRWVGIVFGWIGLVGAFALCRCLGADVPVAAFAAAAVGANPLYLNLSFTYMTDVPFTALVTWAVVAYCIGSRDRSTSWIVLGTLLALLATLTRQTGVALPMSLAAALVIAAPREPRSWITAAVVNAVVFVGYTQVTRVAYGPLDAATLFSAESIGIAARGSHVHFHLVKNGLAHLCYLGCFLAPLAILCVHLERRTAAIAAGCAAVSATACLGLIVYLRLEMPPGINLVYNLGLGRRMLSDPPVVPTVGEWVFWILVGLGFFVAIFAAIATLVRAAPRWRELRTRPELIFAIGLPFVFLGPHLMRAPCFDRYVLPVLAVVFAAGIALLRTNRTSEPGRTRWIAAALALLALASFSLVGTRDYLSHHRVRNALLEDLEARGVDARRISGGFEFNGYRNLERREDGDGVTWVYVNGDDFVVTDRETLEGYELLEERSFTRWMPPGRETLRSMRKTAAQADSAQPRSGLVPAAPRRSSEGDETTD